MAENRARLAQWLIDAHRAGRRFEPFAAAHAVESLAGAYEVQREYVRLQSAARRTSRAGYKIGLTSAKMQEMCGIDTPVAGVVLQDRVHASGVRLDRSDFGRFGIEFEIAVRVGRDLKPLGRPFGFAEVAQAVEAVAPAIEIVDDRHCDYETLDVLSLVSDNAWNAGIVLGEFNTAWPDLVEVEGTATLGDTGVVDRGRGRDVLGNPLLPVLWLANHLGGAGEALLAGEVVMTGSMITTKFPTGPGRYRFEVTGLGSVELVLTSQT